MGDPQAAAFWSYAHADNASDEGGIIALSRAVINEYSLITGSTLSLFVDRKVKWGDEWRKRIDHALVETTFFIPVLSPRYFQREECRRELQEFSSKAVSLGVTELILPILYVSVPDLNADNSDEAVALASRLHYVDWRENRLLGASSPQYRQGVNAMAQRLAQAAAEVAGRQIAEEARDADNGEETPDLMEVIGRITEALPRWVELMQLDWVTAFQHRATDDLFWRQRQRAGKRGGAAFAVYVRFSREFLTLAERHVELAQEYSSRTLALDPHVQTALRLVEEHPETRPVVSPLEEALNERQRLLEEGRRSEEEDNPDFVPFADFARRHQHLSRAWARAAALHSRADEYVDEANAVADRWVEALAELDRSRIGPGDPGDSETN